jgi:hypothetical protein
MFNDVELSIKEIPNFITNMDEFGIKSICKVLQLPLKGLEFIDRYELLQLVLEKVDSTEIDNSICLRFNNDIALGIPSKNASVEKLNDEFNFLMDAFDVSFNQNKSKLLINDSFNNTTIKLDDNNQFNMGCFILVDLLTNMVTFKTNVININTLAEGIVPNFDINPNFNIIKLKTFYNELISSGLLDNIVSEVKSNLVKLTNRNSTVQDILLLRSIDNAMHSANKEIFFHIETATEEIKNKYKPPENSLYQIDVKTLNCFPTSWKNTATCDSISVYDSWMLVMNVINELKISLMGDDDIFDKSMGLLELYKFHIILSKIFDKYEKPIYAELI